MSGRADGQPLYRYKTTNGYEAMHSVRIWTPEKVHNRQKAGPDQDSDCLAWPQGQARPCQQQGCFSGPRTTEAWRNLSQTGRPRPLLPRQPLGTVPRPREREAGQRSLRSKVFLQRLKYGTFQAPPWPSCALSTLERGSTGTPRQKQPVWPPGRRWKKGSEAKSRAVEAMQPQ